MKEHRAKQVKRTLNIPRIDGVHCRHCNDTIKRDAYCEICVKYLVHDKQCAACHNELSHDIIKCQNIKTSGGRKPVASNRAPGRATKSCDSRRKGE